MSERSIPESQQPGPSPLDVGAEEFRRLGYRVVDMAADYLAGLRKRPAYTPMPDERRAELKALQLPEVGWKPDAILDFISSEILTGVFGAHPRFFGWIVPSSAPMGALADFLASVINVNMGGVREHAGVYLEMATLRSLMELVGFEVEGSTGVLVSGGSVANLIGLAAARTWAAKRDGHDLATHGATPAKPWVVYASEEVHSCMDRAVKVLELGSEGLRRLPTDERFCFDMNALREAIATDRQRGKAPFCVVASMGTVGSGAIDPLKEIAEICLKENLWLHVDGSYGAIGLAVPERDAIRRSMAHAQSLALDPHKWLAVPFDCGAALVRDEANLRQTFSMTASYLVSEDERGIPLSPAPFYKYGLQLSRGFRALKLWAVLQQLGRSGVSRLVDRHCSIARSFAETVRSAGDLELLAPVDLSIVCFRYAPAALRGNEAQLNKLNQEILWRTQSMGDFILSSTSLKGRFALRACFLNHWTLAEDVSPILQAVCQVGSELIAST